MLHVLCLTDTLGGEAHQFTTSVNDALGLSHTTLCIVRIDGAHRLNADGIITTDSYLADTRLC